MTSRWDIESALMYSEIPALARLVVLSLLTKADNKTAIVPADRSPSLSTLAAMTGIARGSLTEWLKALEAGGWVRRSQPEKKGLGRTIYTLAIGTGDVVLADRSTRIPRQKKAVENGDERSPASPRGGLVDKGQGVRVADGLQVTSGPPRGRGVVRDADRNSPPRGHASLSSKNPLTTPAANELPNTPVASTAAWAKTDRKTTAPKAVAGRTGPLFSLPKPVTEEALTLDIHKVIHRWLEGHGFTGFGLDEIRKVHQSLIVQFGTKLGSANYMHTVIANGAVQQYAEEIRKARNTDIERAVADMQASYPPCPHGTPAGDQPHPTTRILLCAMCRRGIAPVVARRETDPAVEEAVLAWTAKRGPDAPTTEVLNIAQQAEAFLAEGLDPARLTALAAAAGAAGRSLIQIAQEVPA